MPSFGKTSMDRLSTCDIRLQLLFMEVIKYVDCTVVCGTRTKEEQDAAFREGRSKVQYPNSRHNTFPSQAIDVAPFPVEWPTPAMGAENYARALGRWYMFVGFVRAIAAVQGIELRCGADWDGDFQVKDQNFHDLPHFELKEKS